MTKLLFQALHRPDRSPSQRYRFDQFLPYLNAAGVGVEYSYLISEQADKYFYSSGFYLKKMGLLAKSMLTRLNEWRRAKNYDVCLIQRESFMLGTSIFERAMGRNTRTIFDFDDAIWQTVVSEGNKALSFLKNGKKTEEIIRASGEIWAGNEYLADYARQFNPNTQIIPTVVDTNFYKAVAKSYEKAQICIGWSGSFSTVAHFEHILPALLALKQKYGDRICFKLIGDANYRQTELSLQGIAWQKNTEIEELAGIDIGIMPLPDDEWTRGKCGLKSLVYMSSFIPTVVSPVGVNARIVQDNENGFWATTKEEWVEKISILVENPQIRTRLAQAARQTVEQMYSVEAWQETVLQRILGTKN